MKSQEDIQYSQNSDCIFCPHAPDAQPSNLYNMMNQALVAKHSSHSNNPLIIPIDILLKLQDPTSRQEAEDYAIYKQFTYIDQDEENLKRWYQGKEFQGKINMLSEYYKFHKDIPRVIETSIEKILGKYYDRKRQYDYKCIKKILKQEQGLSITSVEETVSDNSDNSMEQRSRYSTMLNALKDQTILKQQPLMSDSNLLEDICREIGKALPKTKFEDNDFRGVFFESEKKFENYIRKQYEKDKKIRAYPDLQRLRRKSRIQLKPNENYFKLNKKRDEEKNRGKMRGDGQRTLKNNRRQNRSINQNSQDEKKKFVYNTNIKIQIQNAMFYPQDRFHNSNVNKEYGSNDKGIKSRKSLAGKISTLNDDRYRTPVSKIYQPQQTESTKYRKRSTSLRKDKERLRTKQSKQLDPHHYQDNNTQPKRVISSHAFRKSTIDMQRENGMEGFRQRQLNSKTVSVGKLKLQNRRYDDHVGRSKPPIRQSSHDNLRRRSVTINKQISAQKTPIMKYASSEIKDNHRLKGVTINELLTKKLNIRQR